MNSTNTSQTKNLTAVTSILAKIPLDETKKLAYYKFISQTDNDVMASFLDNYLNHSLQNKTTVTDKVKLANWFCNEDKQVSCQIKLLINIGQPDNQTNATSKNNQLVKLAEKLTDERTFDIQASNKIILNCLQDVLEIIPEPIIFSGEKSNLISLLAS